MFKGKPILEVSELTVERSWETIIKDATFSIHSGDFVGIIGPNGGGKSTMLHAILGTLPMKRGSIKLFGKSIRNFKDWGKIAYVSQDAINFDHNFPVTVRELVSLGRVTKKRMGRRFKKSDWEAVDQALEYMGISDLAKKRVGHLSGGQKQRVFVAKALARDPAMIFLDEPVAGVDAHAQERFYKRLSDLNIKKGKSILIVSHDLTAVFCRMSKVICVNREVHCTDLTAETDPNHILKKAYGEHFHFVFHKHECAGVFDNE